MNRMRRNGEGVVGSVDWLVGGEEGRGGDGGNMDIWIDG